jgi:hypothetical protein
MASENIKLRKRNFTIDDGYFYMIDDDQDNLLKKTDDGNTAFSYPLDTLLTSEVKSLEFDGVYFWSLQASGTNSLCIRRWQIDNYICRLQQTISLVQSGSHKYDSDAFSVEHYHTALSATASGGSSVLYIDDYWENNPTISGAKLYLGPNSSGEAELVTVTTTVSGGVNLSSPTTYAYDSADLVNYFNNLWVFNNYNGLVSTTGALYKINAWTGAYIKKYENAAYKDVEAATFYKVPSFTEYGDTDMLCYVKGTNTLFSYVTENDSNTLSYYGSMVMENIKNDEATVITVYDMAIALDNLYRLQLTPDGTATVWTYYSYLLSPLSSFVTSISLSASPAIIAANGLSTSTIAAVVKDQFLQPIVGRNVTFSEDGDGSITGGTVKATDSDGRADTVYTSGTSAQEVQVTAVVEQTN